MVKNPFMPTKARVDNNFVRPENQSAGILDDYAVRKNVATLQGTIQKVPVDDDDIANKKYVDDEITALGSNFMSTTGDTATGNYNFDSGVLFIDSTNNRIGINDETPSYSLDVAGVINGSDSIALPSNGTLFFGGHNSQYYVWGYSGHVLITTGGVDRIKVDSSGRVGIGTTSPATSAKVDITSTTGALIVSRMTTTQRDALTAVNGMIIYNTTLSKIQGYQGGAWVNFV